MLLVERRDFAESGPMKDFFAKLGRDVLSRWQKADFSPERFPDIACAALKRTPPSEQVDLPGLIREFLLDDEQPFQTSSPFGQPELVVYDHPRFYIQILFWLEGTMDIHQHTFSGAFHVLSGSSLHSHFAFRKVDQITAHLRLGDLQILGADLLETGSTVPIHSGAACIHSLFHLDTPSLTVVVRTHNDPGTGPQYNYLPPHVAVDPFQSDHLTSRRKQLLDVLEGLGDDHYADLVQEMIGNLDLERGFFILQNAMPHLQNLGRWDEVWSVFARRHGSRARKIAPTLDEIVWRDNLIGLRSSVTDADHRFFLALLLNVPQRKDILALVARRYGGSPRETILRWVEELSDSSPVATFLLDAEFPPEIPAKKPLATALAALRFFLDEKTTPAPRIAAAKLELLRASFQRSSLRALVGPARRPSAQ